MTVVINNPNALDGSRFRVKEKEFTSICNYIKGYPNFHYGYLINLDGEIYNLRSGYFVKPNKDGMVRLQTIKGFMDFSAEEILRNTFSELDIQKWREGIRRNEVVAWNYTNQSRRMGSPSTKMTLD